MTMASNRQTQSARLPQGPQIYQAVKNGKSLEELGRNCGMKEEEFLDYIQRKVGRTEFKRLSKQSRENSKKASKQHIDVVNDDSVNIGDVKEDIEMKKKSVVSAPVTIADLQNQLSEARLKLELAEGLVKSQNGLILIADKAKNEAQEELEKAQKAYEEAQKALGKAQKAYEEAQMASTEARKKLSDAEQTVQKWNECVANIENQIDNFVVYLVAPGYKGELPACGRKVSATQIVGCEVEEGADDLLVEPRLSEIFRYGYKGFDELADVIAYARLVIKYKFDDKPFKILLDDERVKRVLEAQLPGEIEELIVQS